MVNSSQLGGGGGRGPPAWAALRDSRQQAPLKCAPMPSAKRWGPGMSEMVPVSPRGAAAAITH